MWWFVVVVELGGEFVGVVFVWFVEEFLVVFELGLV